jgi:hypothetical protein
MEPHPVPQNFLSTEFKLFGAFTLKQFVRILLGILMAIGIFIININILVKLPLIAAALGIGVMTAIIPGFEKWVFGYIKAIFVSPRYVWQKQKVAPDILFSPAKTKDESKDEGLESALDKKMIDINKLPLDKLFGTVKVVDPVTEDTLDAPKENVNAIYEDVFGKEVINTNRAIPVEKVMQENKPISAPAAKPAPQKIRLSSVDDYKREIERLKYELTKFAGKDPVHEKQITDQINELFMEVKLIMNDKQFQTSQSIHNKLSQSAPNGKMIVGIVVTKKDIPVSDAVIDFVASDRVVARVGTSAEGKFSISSPLPLGTYDVKISHPTMRFHTYKISIAEGNPTGFKFREK